MNLTAFLDKFGQLKQIDVSAKQTQITATKIHWKGLVGSAKALCASALAKQVPGNHLFLLPDKESAAYFLNDLENCFPNNKNLAFYPASYRNPYEVEASDNANIVTRAETLDKINNQQNTWIVSYPKALFEKIPTQKQLVKNTFRLEVGKEYNLDFLNELLLEYQFERVDFVYEPGQFSIRGGILDVYSYSNDHPFRVEFFGNEIDSIRNFNPVDQLSFKVHQFFTVVPNIQQQLSIEQTVSLINYIGKSATVWLSSYHIIEDTLKKEYEKAVVKHSSFSSDAVNHLPPNALFFHAQEWKEEIGQMTVFEWGSDYFFSPDLSVDFAFQPQPSFNKNFDLLAEHLQTYTQQTYTNIVVSDQAKQLERLYKIFESKEIEAPFTTLSISLKEGFIVPELKMLCYTDHQLFERYHRFRLKENFAQSKQALTLKELYNLQKGDFVSHIDHGVGRFSGLETIDVNGKPQEAVRLVYRDNDVLYVSVHSLHKISKYTGKDGASPTLNKLGTATWSNLKNKTKKKIKEIAFDLIQLYAKRKSQPGFRFSPDTYLQYELEASFMYEDTPDQLKATLSVKEDMESDTPMDRLICGDVGFGKTEVAIRAAFKAVADNKQVAILVPTTILSMQHYRSFKERLVEFPCQVDYINRFKSQKKVNETLKKLKEGKIDILIGTHKIVGKNVHFSDLGLIIIDEEQKFGVAVKDKLKLLRATVDTLTLTATPIPRTLQFSLMGARDLSIINTPPPNRQPILTQLISFNEEQIRDAIAYELSRGGQVYFVHNKLQNIKEVSGMISRLCPGVKVAIGHGQMEGEKLEKIMIDFIEGEYDVLLATTIIESGIDIPNANTIIINNAQNFGLSDLHQLRGRVGRSNKKGFCYLIAPKHSDLTSEARKRLDALVQFSDLGAGFNIAMKDLDIRGAGNMLGGEQSGFIADIGFDMYQKILNEAIEELQENEFKELFQAVKTEKFVTQQNYVKECTLETDLEVRIPDEYVNNVSERLILYQELDSLSDEEALIHFKAEMIDRFGPLPSQVDELFVSMQLRWLAKQIGFEKLVLKSERMIGYFIANQEAAYYQSERFTQILNYVQSRPLYCELSEKNNKLRLLYGNINSMQQAFFRLKEIVGEEVH
jgi:transcription-repair coupling factor (superfamily II helicase)